jgi:heat-inducible transcriptional repressor
MADLEVLGLVSAPHTSAGRIPTTSGYRLFVDSLLTVQPLQANKLEKIKEDFEIEGNSPLILETASKILSGLTSMAGLVSMPKREVVNFRHIEFLALSNLRVLVILVTNEQEVQNRVINVHRSHSASELVQISNYLNQTFEGKSLAEVRKIIVAELQDTQQKVNNEMISAVEMAHRAFKSEKKPSGDYVLSGETNLMGFNELADMAQLRQLFDAFNQKQEIIHILDRCDEAEGVQVFIGAESGYEPLDNCSIVTSSYRLNEETVGVLGVIGPTRMEYEQVIPLVDVTAKILSSALNQK